MECEWCCSLEPTLLCGECKDVAYCNEDCAKSHWDENHHLQCIGDSSSSGRTQLLLPIKYLFSNEGIGSQYDTVSVGTYHAAKLLKRNGINPNILNRAMKIDLRERREALSSPLKNFKDGKFN